MTHSSIPAPSPDQESLFAAAAADYARYRPGVPEAAVRLLAEALHGRPGGSERRAGTRATYTEPRRSYQEDLAASAFTDVSEYRYPVARTWTPAAVVGYLRSTSFAHPDLFQDRHEAFEAEARQLLGTCAKDGTLQEEAVFTVLLARRPWTAS
ncbi:hypothetical protein [Streptomyces sp. NBC_00057]|uniref:hypothetical protein n=1 Tax=Streptomyces sp. NBC_00057 TaxID=2975634 RepID=UPI003250A4CC